jgi:hypothetical protein
MAANANKIRSWSTTTPFYVPKFIRWLTRGTAERAALAHGLRVTVGCAFNCGLERHSYEQVINLARRAFWDWQTDTEVFAWSLPAFDKIRVRAYASVKWDGVSRDTCRGRS